jgi:tol-pal system protein YbgF
MAGFLVMPVFGVSEDPLQQFKLASLAYQNGRYDSAEQEFQAFLSYHGKHKLAAQAQLALGEIKFALKKYPEAADHYSAVIKKYGGTYEAMNAELRFGQCEFNMKKYLSAIDHFKVVKLKAPKVLRSEALLGEALAMMQLKNKDKAESLLTDLLQSYPKYKMNPAAIVPLGLIYIERNRLQEADELLSLLPEDLGARFYKGVTLRKLGQTIAASQIFKDVAEAEPEGYWADKSQLQMAEAYYQVNELNLAYDSFRKVFDKYLQSPLRPYALHRMACIQFQLGRFQEAGLKWEQLVRTFQDDVNLPSGIYMLGEMALRQGEYGKAISFFSQIADTHELRMDAQYKIIWCLAQQKQDETTVARAEQFLKMYPWGDLAAKTHLIKGICLQRMAKYREANQEYQIVIDQFGNSIFSEKAMYLMATAYFQNNQLAEIVTSLNSMLKLAPVSPTQWQADTYLWVAEAYYALGQFEAAGRTYQLVVDNYKETPKLAHAMLGVASSLAKAGKYDEAAVAHERALGMAENLKSQEVKRSVLMDTAQVLFTQKKYDKAMGYFDEFVNRYPDDPLVPEALYQAGASYYRLEYYTEAMNRWGRLVKNYPQNNLAPDALYQIGKTLFGLGNYAEAAVQLQLLIDKYPQYSEAKAARVQIAQSYYNQGRFDLAAERLQEFLNNYPKDPKAKDVLELLQMAHYRQGKMKGDLMALTEKFPTSKLTADIYWQLGADAFNEKQYKQALQYFQKLVGEFPEAQQVAQAYFYMAECHFNLQEFPKAVTAYKNYVLNFPKAPNRIQALFRLGVSHFQAQNFNEAVIAFNDALEADPNGPLSRDAMINIPLCYKKLNQPNEALNSYERILTRFPDDQQKNKIRYQMGELNEEIKEYEAALKHYQQIPDGAPEIFDSLVAQGRVYRLLKLPNKELAAYEKLRNMAPGGNDVRITGMVTLAEIYQEMGKVDDSIAVYEDIAKNTKNPEWKQAAIERAKVLRAEGR